MADDRRQLGVAQLGDHGRPVAGVALDQAELRVRELPGLLRIPLGTLILPMS